MGMGGHVPNVTYCMLSKHLFASVAATSMRYSADAAVYHDCRTAPDAWHVRTGLAAQMERLTAVPALVIEADSHDERLLSLDRLQGQLAEFMEQRLERSVGAVGTGVPR